jgi:hypothetical protein
MAISTNLGITLVEVSQSDKEGAINNAINTLDTSLSARFVHNMSSDSDYTINTSTDENYNLIIEITDTGNLLTATRNIILPNTTQAHIVKNSTTKNIVFKTLAGTGVTVIPSAIELVYSNGTSIEAISTISAIGFPYDLHFFYPGIHGAASTMSMLVMMRTVLYTATLAGSYCKSLIAATSSNVFSIKKNGTEFATATFAIGATSATFTMASDTTFNAGDILTVVSPAIPDATLAGISLNITGLRF